MGKENRETMTIDKSEIATIKASDIVGLPEEHAAEFEGHKPLAGAEHLGRAIVDKNGFPSGSPANYEVLRAASVSQQQEIARIEAGPTAGDIEAALASIVETEPAEQ